MAPDLVSFAFMVLREPQKRCDTSQEQLQSRGCHVVGVCLPGHGTTPTDLNHTTWHEWIRAVETTFDNLKRETNRVAVVGQSLGGLLALELATRRPGQVYGLATLATPLWLSATAAGVASVYRRIPKLTKCVPHLPKGHGGSDIADQKARARHRAYSVVPANSLVQLRQLMLRVRARLPLVRAPLMVVHSWSDHTAAPACAVEIFDRVSSRYRKVRWLERSHHILSDDLERHYVATEIFHYLATIPQQGS